ncbi:uncharacterized protein [Aquarana catesbeiana]|uniref:uncharacterized protein isoform X1 n=1 Tax=Aquarana catesbeiana TaxID=8400 RepID=UPI003CC9BB0C
MIWLCLMLQVLFCKGLAVNLTSYHPENTLFVDEKSTANIFCHSGITLDTGSAITWFRRTLKIGEPPQIICSWLNSMSVPKYNCDIAGNSARLNIHDVQSQDSGVYYCTVLRRSILNAFDLTTLIARSNCRSPVSVYLLAPAEIPHDYVTTVQLACLVQKAYHSIYIRWNISGAYYMGRMSSTKELNGTWTFLNYISLPVDKQSAACEVWLGSSFVSFTWNKSKQVPTLPASTPRLQMFSFCVRFVLVVCILLTLVIFVHLSSTYT